MAEVDPLARFAELLERAARGAPFDPTAATLATVDAEGRPSARTVLIKGADARGLRFFTNYQSRKARDMAANPHAALCIYWPWLDEQARAEGEVSRLPAEESDEYFATRPRGSQLGAWASRQSEPLGSRFALLRRVVETEARYLGGAVPRPPFWGGYLLVPRRIEFWRARRSRLHERLSFTRVDDRWQSERLQP